MTTGKTMKEKTFIIYRDRITKNILKYSVFLTNSPEISLNVERYNNSGTRDTAEIVFDHDLKALIEISEENKKLKKSDLRDLEDNLNQLSNEFYNLKEALNDQ